MKCKANKIEINSNAFLEIWPEMSQKLDRILKKYHICQAFDTEWSNEIKTFLISIRLLPFKPGARSVASVETFQNSVKRLLVFSNVLHCLMFTLSEFNLIYVLLLMVGVSGLKHCCCWTVVIGCSLLFVCVGFDCFQNLCNFVYY